jgi:uncharacterized flavoprotein (TIGR03862 family)
MKKVVIVGAGPAGLMTAHFLSHRADIQIELFDANKAVARKFLVAGHGGFNLTNTKELSEFIARYNHPIIKKAVSDFTNQATIVWLSEIGIETYIGSSGKIFPKKGIKPIEVLTNWLDYLEKKNVSISTEHQLFDFDGKTASFKYKEEILIIEYDILIFAMGGASWKKTGSTGAWATLFEQKGIQIISFEASNAGIVLENWNENLGGGILKNVEITIGNQKQFGEIELTQYGMEGAPIYALSNQVRKGEKELSLNLKPTLSSQQLISKFKAFKGSKTDFLREIKLPTFGINLIKNLIPKEDFINDDLFLNAICKLTLPIECLRPIDEAISTVGGISMNEINNEFQLNKYPNHYCIGEMLDWDAPTGGYLLQACFATGYKASHSIIQNL